MSASEMRTGINHTCEIPCLQGIQHLDFLMFLKNETLYLYMSTYSKGWSSTLSIRNPISERTQFGKKNNSRTTSVRWRDHRMKIHRHSPYCLSNVRLGFSWKWKEMPRPYREISTLAVRTLAGWLARLFCPSAFKIQWERWESMRYVLDWVSLVVIMYIRRRGWTLAVPQLLWEHGSVAIAKHFLGR